MRVSSTALPLTEVRPTGHGGFGRSNNAKYGNRRRAAPPFGQWNASTNLPRRSLFAVSFLEHFASGKQVNYAVPPSPESAVSFEFREPLRVGLTSIVIPCYNAARYLTETLESALTQTYTPTEIIVVDDGSTDGSAELMLTYGNRVKAEFGPNRGPSAARNRGTALARGEFIQYLDADDLLMPDAIEKRVAALQRSTADVAYSDWEMLIESKPNVFEVGERVTRHIEEFHVSPDMAMLNGFWVPLPAIIYRRSVVEKFGGWNEELGFAEDGRFMIDAALAGARFVRVAGVGTRVRVHPTSLSRRTSEAAVAMAAFRNGSAWQNAFEDRGELNPEQRYAIARMYNYAGRSLFFHDRAAFRNCLERLYEVEPGFQLSWTKIASLTSSMIGFEAAGRLLTAGVALRRSLRSAIKTLRAHSPRA